MSTDIVHISSLDLARERVLYHLRQSHHTALVGSPGSGMTTFLGNLTESIGNAGFYVISFDAKSKSLQELLRELEGNQPGGTPRRVVIIDHFGWLLPDDFRRSLVSVSTSVAKAGALCLWCGNLDVRAADRELDVKLCSVPSAHISLPILTRDELTAAYRAIASVRGCRWGEAIQYLMLDLCGTDLSLVKSATDYLHGNWSDRLYDESVWDRIQAWLKDDETVDSYRNRLSSLPPICAATLALIRFGGKPQCLRTELIEEVDDGLRRLCLGGFIIPNLLPGFYQLRNLVVRFLLDESVKPELLFRCATNERASVLLQDAEMMLRQVLASVFARIGVEAARERLQAMQQPGEVIDKRLNRLLLKWAKENSSTEAAKGLNELLMQHRADFKKTNSVWATTNEMIKKDGVSDGDLPHLRCIDYLTFDQLGGLVLGLMPEVFARMTKDNDKKKVRGSWQEGVAKVRRLRNQVAHLRNVGFQDMEDLTRTLEKMRRDIIDYGGWKDSSVESMEVAEPLNHRVE